MGRSSGFPLPPSKAGFFLVFLLAGCSGSTPKGVPATPAFLDDLVRNTEKRSAVSGNVLVTTSMSGKSVTVPGVLLVDFPANLRLELQDPVGGIQLLLVLSGGDFWLYRHDKPEILTGPLSALPPGLLPPLTAEEVVRLFLARPYGDRIRRSELRDGTATFRAGSRLDTVLWEGSLPEPSAWLATSEGRGGAGARYEDYEFKTGLRYPTKIHLEELGPGGESREVLVAWKDWEASVPNGKKTFEIPQPETFGRKVKRVGAEP